jgi:hypothetical protein
MISPDSSKAIAVGTHTIVAPTIGRSEQNAMTMPQKTGGPIQQPEGQSTDGASNCRHHHGGPDAGDHKIARAAHQAFVLEFREWQSVLHGDPHRVGVAQHEEEGEQHGHQAAQRRERAATKAPRVEPGTRPRAASHSR